MDVFAGGNQKLRDVIQSHVGQYIAAKSKTEKGQVISAIVTKLRRESPSGVGLVRQNPKTLRWSYIGLDKAKDKIGHALRKASQEYHKKQGMYHMSHSRSFNSLGALDSSATTRSTTSSEDEEEYQRGMRSRTRVLIKCEGTADGSSHHRPHSEYYPPPPVYSAGQYHHPTSTHSMSYDHHHHHQERTSTEAQRHGHPHQHMSYASYAPQTHHDASMHYSYYYPHHQYPPSTLPSHHTASAHYSYHHQPIPNSTGSMASPSYADPVGSAPTTMTVDGEAAGLESIHPAQHTDYPTYSRGLAPAFHPVRY